jgi:hypothetical protein
MEKAWKCMDETALIAFGILLEETVREVLGETGDLAFTEAADEQEERALASEAGEDGHEEQEQEQRSTLQTAEHEENHRSDLLSLSSDDGSEYSTTDSD